MSSTPMLLKESKAAVVAASTLVQSAVHVAGPSRPNDIDPIFAGVPGILKTYRFDYDAVTHFDTEVAWSAIVCSMVVPTQWPMLPCIAGFYSAFAKDNIRDRAHAMHIAITHDGIKYVVEQRKTGCRFDCQDIGKISKTVPYDKMTDCDIEEPAGAAGPCCYLVPKVLHVVHIDTASSGARTENGVMHELTIRGLVDPETFKRDVWAMKRGEPVDGVDGTVAPLAVSMIRDGTGGGGGGGGGVHLAPLLTEQTALLREMVATLKETNELLKGQQQS